MGMDIYGVNPTKEEGKYFRNNVWWGRPLAEFIQVTYPNIANKCEHWQTNDGDGLAESDVKTLAERLEQDLVVGRVREYEESRQLELASLDREPCQWCNSTGIRTDHVGVSMGFPKEALPTETAILVGRTHGTCNACEGIGTKENWELNYCFTEENVAEFLTFLKSCGGFTIC